MNEVERTTEYVVQCLQDDNEWSDFQFFYKSDREAINRLLYLRQNCTDQQFRVIERVTIDSQLSI